MYMLDTNICIYILKNHPEEALDKFRLYSDELSISTIVYAELQYGIELSPAKIKQIRLEQLIEFLSLIKIKDWNQSAANKYAKIRKTLKQKGSLIGNMDMLIAAHAISKQAILVTNNIKEFNRVPELKIENWVNQISIEKK
ncbi:MAG: type II toxin-antitoxin system VapC family toxin [Gammaproteobacteria bacterium]|nr:type II toxin-antitoxin system VapC family toxin [Gammaproteobacteria bacterium]